MTRVFAILIAALALNSAALSASRLLNYENRVVRAAEQVARIRTDRDYGEEGIAYIKKLLPGTEEIEVEDGVVTVDNSWLHQALDGYQKENDAQKQLATLNQAEGWLRDLDDHLRRAQSFEGGADANESREKLRSILMRREFQTEQETRLGRFVKEVRQRITEFLREILSAIEGLIERLFGAGARTGWVSIAVILALLAAAGIGVVRMARAVRPNKRRDKKRRVLGEEIPAGTTSGDLLEAALARARAGDFRSGVRNLYLSLLYELNERGLLELDESATNHEYLERVSSVASVASPMRYLTDRFDYFWYGKIPSSEEEFAICLSRYEEAINHARALGQPV